MNSIHDVSVSKKLGEAIRIAREKVNLTQEEVANKTNMTSTYYAMIERGEANPSWGKVNRILTVLNLKLSIKEK